MSEWFVPGEPAVWLGSGEKDWKLKVGEMVALGSSTPPEALALEFRVRSFLRAGQPFDLDNMVTPVFEALLGPRRSPLRSALALWSASRIEDTSPGLRLLFQQRVAPFPAVDATLVLDVTLRGRLPVDSRDGGTEFVAGLREGLGDWSPRKLHRFAVEVRFGDDTSDITWVAEHPIKPVVDCLFPVLGGTPGAPDDWKVHALRVSRGNPDLRGACLVRVWVLASSAGSAENRSTGARTVTLSSEGASLPHSPRRSVMSNYERLDEAAKALGSPPAGVRIGELLTRAASIFPDMANVSKDSASATMDFQTINVRGRTNRPGDFNSLDRWNRWPAFIKLERGVWRRLSDDERARFAKLWARGEPLLRQESFDGSDWDDLMRGSG